MWNKKNIIFVLVMSIAMILVGCSKDKKSAAIEAIEREVFTYVTSSYDASDKAEVFVSDLTVEQTSAIYTKWKQPNDFMMTPGIESVTLYYDDVIYFIYMGDDGQTYVQKSSLKYVHQNGYNNAYRPYSSNYLFLGNRYYGQTIYKKNVATYGKSKSYSSYDDNTSSSKKVTTGSNNESKIITSQSIRSSSTSTRSYTGGGTSYGK